MEAYKPYIGKYLAAKGYQVNSKGITNCPFPEHHTNGDKKPSAQVNQDYLYCYKEHKGYDIWEIARRFNGNDFKAGMAEESIKNYDPEKDFRPDLLCGCACPAGSINIIAARPAGGKTSAMINIVRETLTLNANPEKKKRKILYVNLEMNYRQILTNLHLSCIYNFADEEREKLSQLKKTIFAFNHTLKKKIGRTKNGLRKETKKRLINQ